MVIGGAAVALSLGIGVAIAASPGSPSTRPGAGGAWEIFVSDRAAQRLGIGAGDPLDVSIHPTGPWRTGRVARVYRPRQYPTEVAQGQPVIRMHLPDLQALIGRGDEVDSVIVRLHDPARADRVASRLNALGLGFRAYTSADLAQRSSSTFEVITRFHRAIGVVTILASSVFLVTIMTLKGEEMRRQVGLMRLIGISRRTVSAAVLLIAAGITLAGTAIGIAGGYLLSAAINVHYRRVFDTDLLFSRVTSHLVVLAAILSAILGIAAGGVSVWRLLRRTPLEQVGR